MDGGGERVGDGERGQSGNMRDAKVGEKRHGHLAAAHGPVHHDNCQLHVLPRNVSRGEMLDSFPRPSHSHNINQSPHLRPVATAMMPRFTPAAR